MTEWQMPEPMIQKNTLGNRLAKHFDPPPESWVKNELFEQASEYLARGRRLKR